MVLSATLQLISHCFHSVYKFAHAWGNLNIGSVIGINYYVNLNNSSNWIIGKISYQYIATLTYKHSSLWIVQTSCTGETQKVVCVLLVPIVLIESILSMREREIATQTV